MLRNIKALDDSSSSSNGENYEVEDGNFNPPSNFMEDLMRFEPPEKLC